MSLIAGVCRTGLDGIVLCSGGKQQGLPERAAHPAGTPGRRINGEVHNPLAFLLKVGPVTGAG